MKTINRSIGMVALVATMILAVSCKDNKKEHDNSDGHHSEMNADDNQSKMNHDNNNNDGHHDGESKEMAMNGNGASQVILNDYFNLKDALVSGDNAKAKELGATLAKSFGNLNVSNYTDAQKADLKDIIEDAVEHAEHISESDIDHQRAF